MVVLTSYLVIKGSTESKNGQERIERRIKELERDRNPVERGIYGPLSAD
jgi:hypothetical protein